MPSIILTQQEHIAIVTFSRPEAGNVIDDEMASELELVCSRINEDNEIHVAVLAGSGGCFCSGADFPFNSHHPALAIAAIERPVIAAINGDTIGEGLEIALACDIRLASAGARFGLPQVAEGRLPFDGGTQRLPRIVGKGKALEMLLTGDTIGADEAVAIGLVNRVCPDVAREAEVLAKELAAKGPISTRFIKEAVNKGLDLTLDQGLRLEADLYFLLHTTADRTEGIRAFIEKRPPRFQGR